MLVLHLRPDMEHVRDWGRPPLSTLCGGNLTLLGSFGKLAAPRLASASETSRETLVPMMYVLPNAKRLP
jgi:hypothetical protein